MYASLVYYYMYMCRINLIFLRLLCMATAFPFFLHTKRIIAYNILYVYNVASPAHPLIIFSSAINH